MKKLVLLSLACGMFSVSFADGLKTSAPIGKATAIKQSTSMTVNAEAKPVTPRVAKAPFKATGTEEFLQLGNVYNVPWAFGWYNFSGPCIDYHPDMRTVVIANVLAELNPVDTSDDLSSMYSEVGKNGEVNFPQSKALVSQDKLLTRLTQGGILVPPFAESINDLRIYASGGYYDEAADAFDGQAVVVNKFGADASEAVISKKSNNPNEDIYLFESRYRTTAVNNHDGSVWVVMPNFGLDGNNLDYQGNLNMLKTVMAKDGTLSTEIMQVDFPTDFFGTLKMAWSVTGKYGVVGAVTTDPAAEGFLADEGQDFPVYVFTSDYGATWSNIQNAVNMSGPNGISGIRDILKGTLLEDLEKTKDELIYTFNWFDFDVTIDRWGNLYFGGYIQLNEGNGTTNFYPGMSPHGTLYSTANSEADNATNIRNLTEAVVFCEPAGFGEQGWIPCTNMYSTSYGADQRLVGNRFQFTQNKLGTKIAGFWSDAPTYDSGTIQNAPDQNVMGGAWDLETNRFALTEMTEDGITLRMPFNFTLDTDAEGKSHFLCVSRTMMFLEENRWDVPMMCTYIYDVTDVEVNPFYYLGGISFEKSDFKINKQNKAVIVEKGEVPAEKVDVNKFPTAVKDLESLSPIGVYPNPAVNEITVDVEGMVSIYNVSGQLIKTAEVSNGKVNISDLPAGTMIIKAEGKAAQKFIKK